jgi:demethylmenaquinone methyltransferase/2-methoxy-6-polyprenyl-1,4-benzoquinol methylase
MDNRKKYFESYTDEWDKMFTSEDLEILSFLIDSFNIQTGTKVIDLGCGTGILFDMLRRKVGKDGMVVGVDFCPKMVRKARQNFPFETISEIDADVENLPLKECIFDCAISFAAFAHFTDFRKVMQEVARVLKSGGLFHIVHLMSSKELDDYHHKAGGPVANDQLPSDEDMMALFNHGNFTNAKITDHPGLYLASAAKK